MTKEAESIFKNTKHVWQCGCGNCAFMIYEGGGMQCSECDEPVDGWVTTIPVVRTERKYE